MDVTIWEWIKAKRERSPYLASIHFGKGIKEINLLINDALEKEGRCISKRKTNRWYGRS